MRICASVAKHTELALPQLALADMVELRLDLMGSLPGTVPERPLLVTFRHSNAGVEPMLTEEEVQRWAASVPARYLDLELDDLLMLPNPPFQIIRSYHDWRSTPDQEGILRILASLHGDVRKAAFMVHSLKDLVSIHRASNACDHPHVVIGMGELGQITRVRPRCLRNQFTFASLLEGTAPGQLSVHALHHLGDEGMVTGLLGSPISHSFSPAIHNAAFRSASMAGIYLRFDAPDKEEVALLPELMTAYDIRGLNVTMPHKVTVMPHLDSLDPLAEEVGAVNTIRNDDGRIAGFNTDVAGLEGAFADHLSDIRGSRALLVGNGGAARAAAVFLQRQGCDITVTARDHHKGQSFARERGASFLPLDSLQGHDFETIINATPVGRQSGCSDIPVSPGLIRQGQLVMDMVYEPRRTALLTRASECGAVAIPGLEMLLHQAGESFRIWTGCTADLDSMREAVG